MILHRAITVLILMILCGCAARGEIAITRDRFGVPSIKAKSVADAVYGLGYATVQDHAVRMGLNYKQARGRMAEVEGRNQLLTDGFIRSLGIEEVAQAKAKSLTGEMAAVVQSFCDGANRALAEMKEKPAWLEPITPVDVLALAQMVNAAFPLQEIAQRLMPGAGSNQFAWQGSGKAILSADPHLPWEGILAWYEVGIECDDFTFRGVTLPGLPFGAMGHTGNVAWCMTNNDPDLWDFFVVSTNPENRRQYSYHGEWREFEDVSYDLRYRDGDELKTQAHRVRRTAWGPMVPFSSNAAALSMLGKWDGFDNSLRRFRAKNASEFRAALNPPALSMWNIVYADRQGNIGYQYNAMVPRRDETFDWTKPVPGADPKTKWGAFWSLDDLPHAENPKGKLLANANSTSPLTPLGERIAGTWPKYVTSHGPTTRITRLSEILLSSRGSIDAGKAKMLATDTQVPYARAVIAEFKRTPGIAGQDVSEALGVMSKWDGRADIGSRGTGLYDVWLRVQGMPALAMKAAKSPGWDAADRTAALTGLATAAAEMRKNHKLDAPWGSIHFSKRGEKTVPVSGFGFFGQGVEVVAVNPNSGRPRGGSIPCTGGSSFRMIADLKPGGIRSWTILPYGNSTDPKSPHYTDQMELFGRGEYKDTRQRAVKTVTLSR